MSLEPCVSRIVCLSNRVSSDRESADRFFSKSCHRAPTPPSQGLRVSGLHALSLTGRRRNKIDSFLSTAAAFGCRPARCRVIVDMERYSQHYFVGCAFKLSYCYKRIEAGTKKGRLRCPVPKAEEGKELVAVLALAAGLAPRCRARRRFVRFRDVAPADEPDKTAPGMVAGCSAAGNVPATGEILDPVHYEQH